MTTLDDMCEAYWDAFREGYFKVGGRPEDYPEWKNAPKSIKDETKRCMRFAVQPLIDKGHESVAGMFPENMVKRGQPMTMNDQAFVGQTKLAENFD